MKRTLNFAVMLLAVVAVIASGCKKEDNNGGNSGGGDNPATTYTVTFKANGGTGTMQPQTFTEGETKALTANAFTYQTHEFASWNTSADGTGNAYTDGQVITVTANMTLYAQWSNTINGHEWVDLGLPSGLLWATCNVGADIPEAYGNYYSWGETQPRAGNAYCWENYVYANGSGTKLKKYCNQPNFGNNGFTDNFRTLLPEDDAATANWGNGWRMPTETEFRELYENCEMAWTTQNHVQGRLFTASNGNSIFMPAAGRYWSGLAITVGSRGSYWSSSLYTFSPNCAWHFDFTTGYDMETLERCYGLTVRPVCSAQN